ncbi:hypothetical protein PRUPE_1G549900 [Prunus persica]|uniref:HMA domain-containing protein n=1 Tax=Prunus persica TaxID=3760 RepID=A0A251RIR4_PRUPE|nr:hypothetical protein PRUPE_1G549900 [Prunus persica]
MKLIATVEGITSIVLDPSKNTVTVTGDANPVKVIKKVRKFRKSASVMSIGPPPPQSEKKDEKKDLVPFNTKDMSEMSQTIRRSINDKVNRPMNGQVGLLNGPKKTNSTH